MTILKLVSNNKVVHHKSKYPLNRDTLRPFRIWNTKTSCNQAYCYYAYTWTAIDAALKEIQWEKVNTTLEVYDCTKVNRLIATFTLKPGGNIHRYVKPDFNFRHIAKRKKK